MTTFCQNLIRSVIDIDIDNFLYSWQNEKWLKLIAFILKDKLFDFVVDNADDLRLMNDLIKQTFMRATPGTQEKRRPSVIMSKYGTKVRTVGPSNLALPQLL